LDAKFQPVVNHDVGSESCIWHKASTPKDLDLQRFMFGVQTQGEMGIKTIRIRKGLKKKMETLVAAKNFLSERLSDFNYCVYKRCI
jgi:hypothetical protein